MAKKEKADLRKLVKEFIEADIPIAEIMDVPGYPLQTFITNINRSIKNMGYEGVIRVLRRNNIPYIVNFTLVEEV